MVALTRGQYPVGLLQALSVPILREKASLGSALQPPAWALLAWDTGPSSPVP